MTKPTRRTVDALNEFVNGITFLTIADTDGSIRVSIQLPVMGPEDRVVTYMVDPEGKVTQHVAEGPFVEVVTLNGSVFDMLDQVADAEEETT
jgi:hypothetical protein